MLDRSCCHDLFDGKTYDSKDVLTEELKALLGPSLLNHNASLHER